MARFTLDELNEDVSAPPETPERSSRFTIDDIEASAAEPNPNRVQRPAGRGNQEQGRPTSRYAPARGDMQATSDSVQPPTSERDTSGENVLRAYEPTLWDQFKDLFGSNRDRAAVELSARRIAEKEGVSVEEVYESAGGRRPLFNPEGRPPIRAATEASSVVGQQVPDIVPAAVNTVLRTIRGGDEDVDDSGWLDRAIQSTDTPPPEDMDPNYQSLYGVGESLGYSLTTLSASTAAFFGGTAVSSPVGGGVAALGASSAVSYRASRDKFMSMVREHVDAQSEFVHDRPLTQEEWEIVQKDIDAAATKYGAWEAVPEAASNLIFIKAFSLPLRGARTSRVARAAERAAKFAALTLPSEYTTETATALGQNRAEIEAGLTDEELSLVEAFRQQLLPTTLVTMGLGGSGGVAKSSAGLVRRRRDKVGPDQEAGREPDEEGPEQHTAEEVDTFARDRVQQIEAAEAPSETEQQERDFLRQNIDNPQVIASAYGVEIVPTGERERARAETPPPTPEDQASPIPTETIQAGRENIQDALGQQSASQILEGAGFPPINSTVNLTTDDGAQVAGTVVDAFDENGVQGAKVQLDDGTVISEPFAALQGRVTPTREAQDAGEVRGDAGPVQGAGAQRPGGEVSGRPNLQRPAEARPESGERQAPREEEATGRPVEPESVETTPTSETPTEAERAPISRRDVEGDQGRDTAVTETGRRVPVRYAVVDAADLVASQQDDGRSNPDYPAELQPRDRSRAVSDAQISDLLNPERFDPRILDRSPQAHTGAPIVAADGIVESGNGRILALRKAYREGREVGQTYRNYLAEQGYPVDGMSQPVLVRVREGQMEAGDRAAFTREANKPDTLGMSATERAMADSAALTDPMLDLYEGGDVDAAANRPFVRAFLDQVAGRNEQADMLKADGSMSPGAVRRIEAALFAKAYGDVDLVSSLIESLDTNIKAIGGALMDVAAPWAQMRADAKSGQIDPAMDQTERLLEAVRLIQRARREKRNVAEMVDQRDLMSGDALHPDAEAFLRLMFRNTRNWTQPAGREKLSEALKFYIDAAGRAQPGVDLLGEAAPEPARILETAKERQYGAEAAAEQQQDLLAQPEGGPGERVRPDGEGRAERPEPDAAQEGEPAPARAGEEGAGAEGQVDEARSESVSLEEARREIEAAGGTVTSTGTRQASRPGEDGPVETEFFRVELQQADGTTVVMNNISFPTTRMDLDRWLEIPSRTGSPAGLDALASARPQEQPQAPAEQERRDQAQHDIYARRIEEIEDPAELRAYAEELRTALMTDERTGLGSNRAWLRREPKAYIASVDLDALKWINDNMGHDAGDRMIASTGDAFREAGIADDAFHVSGDEFYVQSDDEQQLADGLERAREHQRGITIEGNGLRFTGPGFSYGIGTSVERAEEALHGEKTAREEAGERAARGERPRGVSSATQVPEQEQAARDRAETTEGREGERAERPEPRVAPEQQTDRIEDFGERIEGARKFEARKLSESLEENADLAAQPLSKTFPQPNYEKLAEEGVPKKSLALVALARAQIPRKPRQRFKLKRWVLQAEFLRDFARKVLDGESSADDRLSQIPGQYGDETLQSLFDTAELIAELPADQLSRAAEYRVMARPGGGFMLHGPKRRIYRLGDMGQVVVEDYATFRERALRQIREDLESSSQKKRDRYTPIEVRRTRRTGEGVLTWRPQGRIEVLKGGFASTNEAREYLENNRDDLQAEIDRLRKGPEMRGERNAPRQGPERRQGDVTPEGFAETFGFRGVQFGNYVEGPRRQQDLNEAYDALIDLAETLDIPPLALSLNGELGLAFGARGKGGRAKAHFEPHHVVINLTKTAGPGSLAHEWLHAVDNYFARQAGGKEGAFITDPKLRPGDLSGVREEMAQAWQAVHDALSTGSFADRAASFDSARSKPYWNTPIEKAARAFEKYIRDRMGESNIANDYLANINEKDGAYPNDEEMRGGIRQAFDRLFETLETRETDRGVEMFSLRDNSAAQAWLEIARNDEVFSYPRSEAKDFEAIMAEVAPDMRVEAQKVRDDIVRAWNVHPDKSSSFGTVIEYDDGTVRTNFANFKQNEGGSAIYAASGNYAYNNGLTFAADKFGVGPVGEIRRIENLISLALKFGTTEFIEPFGKSSKQWAEGDTAQNLQFMLEESYDNALEQFPDIGRYEFDPRTNRITPRPVEGRRLVGAERGRETGDTRDRGRDRGILGRTERRAVVTGHLLRRGGAAGAEAVLLAQHPTGDLSGVLYSAGRGQETAGFTKDFDLNADAITADLADRLKKLGIADRVALRLRERIQAVAEGKASEADGRYLRGMIEIALTAPDATRTLNHEAIHALRDLGVIRGAEWRTLERAARADTDRMEGIRQRYERLGLSEDSMVEEAVADMYADWSAARSETGGFMRRAFERIRDFLRALGNALTGRGYRTADSVFRSVERGEVGQRQTQDGQERATPAEQFALKPGDFNQKQAERAVGSILGRDAVADPEYAAEDGTINAPNARIDPMTNDMAKLVGFFESATDKLRRSGNRMLVDLATRIDRYYDQREARMGLVNGRIRPLMKKLGRRERKRTLETFRKFWRHHDNGRRDEAKALLDDANPVVRQLVEAVQDAYSEIGDINQEVGVKVYDPALVDWDAVRQRVGDNGVRIIRNQPQARRQDKYAELVRMTMNQGELKGLESEPSLPRKGGWRLIGKVRKGEFWPRALRPEVQRVLQNPANDPALWNEIVDDLINEGHIEHRADANKYLKTYFSEEVRNDYFAGIEKARGSKLPEIFYDYSWDAFQRYAWKWSARVSQVEQFGQVTERGTKDTFDEAIESTLDIHTRQYIGAVRDQVYSVRSIDMYTSLLQNLNLLATGTQLGNPATATLNLIGGTTLNVQMFGWRRVAAAWRDLVTDWNRLQQEGVELGILGKDVLNILRDTERGATYFDAAGRAQEYLSHFARFTMTWGGYRGTENLIRATSMIAARAQLTDALRTWNKNPNSRSSRKYREFMRRNRIDPDKLAMENGEGNETSRYLRLMVNIPQGSYRIDMTPLFVDTPVGRFLFKYQKFGTQVSRMFWQNFLQPFVKNPKAGTFLPMLRYFSAAAVGGSAILAARSFLFNYNDPGPDWEDLEEALEDEDRANLWAMIFDRAWYSMLAASFLGFFGNYVQFGLDVADQQRTKSPLDPPGLASIDAVVELVQRSLEQGTLTGRDLDQIGERTLALYRGYKRMGMTGAGLAGSEWHEVRLHEARREYNYIRKTARRYADSSGIASRRTIMGRIARTPRSPINQRISEALIVGDGYTARLLYREALQEAPQEERGKLRASVRSSMRNRQPILIAGSPSKREKKAFLEWARSNVSPANYQLIVEADQRYRRAAVRAGIW